MTILDGLFDARVATAVGPILHSEGVPYPEETAALRHAVPRRRAEFLTGRTLARAAMADLGVAACALPAGPDRVPLWPAGLVGCISHSENLCGVAMARRTDGVRSVGLDIELDTPLADPLWETVCTPAELAWLDTYPTQDRGRMAKRIFGAKECAFKLQYPLTRRMLEFSAFEITFAEDTFTATLQLDLGAFSHGTRFDGRSVVRDGHLVATALI